VLPIIAAVASNPQSGLLLIEQPELHLHPAAQADVAELLVAAAKNGDRQFLVETHSEHLVLRLRRRVAEGAIAPEDVQLLFAERQGRNSKLRPVTIDRSGRVEGWPSGFFDEGYVEAAALARASAKARTETTE
jgi:predicted ATPase